jgi:hypothetical protein
VECESKSDTRNSRGNWNHLKIILIIPEQHTGTACSQASTANSHTGPCTRTLEGTKHISRAK